MMPLGSRSLRTRDRVMKPSEGGTHFAGNRFEADVSPNRKRVDVKDRKGHKLFTLLAREDIEELKELAEELLLWVESL